MAKIDSKKLSALLTSKSKSVSDLSRAMGKPYYKSLLCPSRLAMNIDHGTKVIGEITDALTRMLKRKIKPKDFTKR